MPSKKIFSALAILIFLLFPVFAQKEETIGDLNLESTQEENAEANEIRQPFEWVSAGDVLKYEILIERLDEKTGQTKPVFFHETTEEENQTCRIYIEPILPPGRYFSYIKVFNILGIFEKDLVTRDEFVIRKAYMPDVNSVSYPLYMRSTIYLDDLDNDGIIEVKGKNLFNVDKSKRAVTYTDYSLRAGKRILRPKEVLSHDDEKNREIKLRFDMKTLDVGKYHLFAQDASGLHSEDNSDSSLVVKFRKWMDLDIEAGYVCPIVLHDDTLPTYLDSTIYPISGQARVTFIPFKHSWGYMGMGIRSSYTRLSKEFDGYTIDGNMGTGHVLFVFQLPALRRRLFFEVHGGVGLTYFNNIVFHFPRNIESEALNTISPSFDVGGAVQYYINKRLYGEIAGDYVITINKDMILGMVMPSIGLGWQF